MRITIYNEGVHEQQEGSITQRLYPQGMHGAIADGLRRLVPEASIRFAHLDLPSHGLTDDVLAETDVLLWWGHEAHGRVEDSVVDAVLRRVHEGMGFLALHSAHYSKPFIRLMGTTCSLRWRGGDDRELVWTVNPTHPIAAGVPHPIIIDGQEMYGEHFDIPEPDDLIFISSFTGGEVFRSGATFTRGLGKIFYFSPGDQEYPVYHHPDIQRVIANGVRWAMPTLPPRTLDAPMAPVGWFEK
ncbi:MAG: ThuA domain-containing protein [Rhodoglobus sp.]|nr:ThuA domain-containing protein [Rhodoglobus sp.]